MTGFVRKAQVGGSCQWFGGPAVRTRTFETFLAYPTQPHSGSWHHICIQVKEMSFLSFFITKVGAPRRLLLDRCCWPESQGGWETEPSGPTWAVSKGDERVRHWLCVLPASRPGQGLGQRGHGQQKLLQGRARTSRVCTSRDFFLLGAIKKFEGDS